MATEKQIELRKLSFFPFAKIPFTEPNQFDDGESKLKSCAMNTGLFSLELNLQATFLKPINDEITVLDGETPNSQIIRFNTDYDELTSLFKVGDQIVIQHSNKWFTYFAEVTFISNNKIEFNNFAPPTGGGAVEGVFAGEVLFRSSNLFEEIEVKFNLSPTDSETFANGFDGGNMIVRGTLVPPFTPQKLKPNTGGIENWFITPDNLDYPSTQIINISKDSQIDSKYDEFEVIQKVRVLGVPYIVPYWSQELQEDVEDGTIPNDQLGDNGLKCLIEVKAWRDKSRDQEPVVFEYTDSSDIGWFNENGNGGVPTVLKAKEPTYFNVLRNKNEEGLSLNEEQIIEVELTKNSGVFNQTDKFGLYIARKTPQNEYNQSRKPHEQTYNYSGAIVRGDNTATPTRRIGKDELEIIACQLSNGTKTAKITARYNPKQSTTDTLTSDDEFILSASFAAKNEDDVEQIFIDQNNYVIDTDESNLFRVVDFRLYDPDATFDGFLTQGYTTMNAWIEDQLSSCFLIEQDFDFYGDIEKIELGLISLKEGETQLTEDNNFELYKKEVPFEIANRSNDANMPIYKGGDIEGFTEPNLIFQNSYVDSIYIGGGITNTYIIVPWFIDWKNWVQLKGVPDVFFNQQDSFNGYNRRHSNYSDKPDGNKYDVKLVLYVTCKNRENEFSTTTNLVASVEAYDYGEDKHTRNNDFPDFIVENFTEKIDGTDLNGAILTDQDTIIKTHYINNGRDQTGKNFWFRTNIEEEDATGDTFPNHIDTLYDPSTDSILQPVDGETRLKVYSDGADGYWTECLVDYTKIAEGINYKPSGRIGFQENAPLQGFGYSLGFTDGFDA